MPCVVSLVDTRCTMLHSSLHHSLCVFLERHLWGLIVLEGCTMCPSVATVCIAGSYETTNCNDMWWIVMMYIYIYSALSWHVSAVTNRHPSISTQYCLPCGTVHTCLNTTKHMQNYATCTHRSKQWLHARIWALMCVCAFSFRHWLKGSCFSFAEL